VTDMMFGQGFDDRWPRSVRDRLFDQRMIFVTGTLDHQSAGHAAMELMTLDAAGDSPIHLQIECARSELDAALSLMDVIELTGVPVQVSAIGPVGGPAVGIVAVGHQRTSAPHARFGLLEPAATFDGPAREVERWLQNHQARWRLFCQRFAAAVGKEPDEVAADFDVGRYLDADEALAFGLLDEITRPDPKTLALRPRPMGFGLKR